MLDPKDLSSLQALATRGILTFDDVRELSTTALRIYRVLVDGEWHSSLEIIRAAQPATDAMRILRFFRDHDALILQKERRDGARLWDYRIVRRYVDVPKQQELPLA